MRTGERDESGWQTEPLDRYSSFTTETDLSHTGLRRRRKGWVERRRRKMPVGQCQRAQRDFSSVLHSFHSPEDMLVTVLHPFRSPCLHPVRLSCCKQQTHSSTVCLCERADICVCVCVRACICVRVCVCARARLCAFASTSACVFTHCRYQGVTTSVLSVKQVCLVTYTRKEEGLIYVCKYLFIFNLNGWL